VGDYQLEAGDTLDVETEWAGPKDSGTETFTVETPFAS
jgi:hypothetical protein